MFKDMYLKNIILSILLMFSAGMAILSFYSWNSAKASEEGMAESVPIIRLTSQSYLRCLWHAVTQQAGTSWRLYRKRRRPKR